MEKSYLDGREPIKVYLRLKPVSACKVSKSTHIEVRTEILPFETIMLTSHLNCVCTVCKKAKQVESRQQYAVARSLKSDKQYQFEKVFDGDASQEDLWTVFEPFVDGAMVGFTSTILTYGPASGGKSYTLVGTQDNPGVVPRALSKIFQTLCEVRAADPLNLTEVEMSYVEFSNNVFYNLLKAREKDARDVAYSGTSTTFNAPHPESDLSDFDIMNMLAHTAESMVIIHSDKLDVRENKDVGVFLSGPKVRIPMHSAKQALHFIKWADSNREKVPNDESRNRGHMILTLYVDTKIGNEIKLGRIHFVDLVGGERIGDSSNDAIQDISFINKSLHAFGDVLFALSNSTTTLLRKKSSMRMSMADIHSYQLQRSGEPSTPTSAGKPPVPPSPKGEKSLNRKGSMRFIGNNGETLAIPTSPTPVRNDTGLGHIPYLNSKLTHLLKDSFGGNGLTTMILNMPIENESYHQTVVSYEYAARGRKVMNRPIPCRYEMSHTRYDPNSELSVLKQLKQRLYTPAPPGYDKKKAFVYDRPLMSPTRRVVKLSISNIHVEDAPYLCFPMYPWVSFEVGSISSCTAPSLYIKDHSKFDDELSVEIQPDDFENGIDMEAHVTTKTVGGMNISLGCTITPIRPLFSAYEEKFTHTLPLYFERFGETYQQGRITFEGSVTVTTVKNTALLTSPSSPAKKKSTFLAAPEKFIDSGFDWSQPFAHLVINKISSPDALLGSADNPDLASVFHFAFESKISNQVCMTPYVLGKSRYRGKDVVTAIQTDEPATQFDVTRDMLTNDGLQVMVFMKNSDSVNRAMGRAQFKLDNALIVKLETGVSKDVSSQMKNIASVNAGKVILNMRLFPFGKVHRHQADSRSAIPIDKLLMSPDCDVKDSLEGHLPPNFTAGWVRFKSADAIRLNTLKLLGNHARYAEYLDDPRGLEVIKQDLMLVIEFGDHWASRTSVKSDEEDTAQWSDMDFKLYVERDDLKRIPFKFSVYNLKAQEDFSLISSSLVHFSDLNVGSDFTFDNRPVILRSPWNKKPNGKLAISGVVVKDSVTSWLTAVVVKVHKGGKYDVCYEDGEIEVMVSKDLLSLAVDETKPGTARSAMKLKPRFAVGTSVEIQFDSNDLWFPATIFADHNNGYYDINSDFEIPRNNIHESQIRLSEQDVNNRKGHSRHLTGRYAAGDKVEANYQAKGIWYSAKIWKVRMAPDGVSFIYDLDYKSGERELGVTENRMRSIAVAPSRSIARMRSSSFSRRLDSRGNMFGDDHSEVGSVHSQLSVRGRGRTLERSNSKSGSRHNMGASDMNRSLSRSRSRSHGHSLDEAKDAAKDIDDDEDDDLDSDEEVFAVDETNLELPLDTFHIGDRVEARFRGSDEFFPGTVIDISAVGDIGILYEGGEKVSGVAREDIRLAPPANEAVDGHVDAFKVGDKIEANYRNLGRWMRGKIHKRRGQGVYDIVYADGKVETKVVETSIRKVAIEIEQGFKYSVGDEVEVNIDCLGYWYRGEVVRRRIGNSYDIEFDDGIKECAIIGRWIRRAKPIDNSIPVERPFFVVGDHVLVKSRSKAVDSSAKALKEAKQGIHDTLGVLFKSLRQIEAEEARFKVAKKHGQDESKNLQGVKKEIVYAEAKSKIVVGARVTALKEDLSFHDNAAKLASNLRNEEENNVAKKLADLKKLLAQLSKSEHLLGEKNAEAEQLQRSGLEEEELLSLENSLKSTKLEVAEIEACIKVSDDALHTVKNARVMAVNEDRALKSTSEVAKKLLCAFGADGASSGYGADAFGDLKMLSGDDEDENFYYNDIYKGSKSFDQGDLQNEQDQLIAGSLNDLDELFESKFDDLARTSMGAVLRPNKKDKLDDNMIIDYSKMSDRLALTMGPRVRTNIGIITRSKLRSDAVINALKKIEAFFPLYKDGAAGLSMNRGQQYDFEAAKDPEVGEKIITFRLSRKRAAALLAANGSASGDAGENKATTPRKARGMSMKMERRPSLIAQSSYDVRKSLEEKRSKSNNAEAEYYTAYAPVPKKLDEANEQEKIMKSFVKEKGLKSLLQSPLGKGFRHYVNKVKPLQDAVRQAEEKRCLGEERALAAKKAFKKVLKRAVRATGTKIRLEEITASDIEEEKIEKEAEKEAEQTARIAAEREKRLHAENIASAPLTAEDRAAIIKGNDHLATRMVQLRPVPQEVLREKERAKSIKDPAENAIVKEAKRRQFARMALQGDMGEFSADGEDEDNNRGKETDGSQSHSTERTSNFDEATGQDVANGAAPAFDQDENVIKKKRSAPYVVLEEDEETDLALTTSGVPYVFSSYAKELYEKAKKAAVEEWSCWEDAKLLAVNERKLLDDLLAAQRRLSSELGDVSQFSSVISDYVALRKDWLDTMEKFTDCDTQYELAVHALSKLKRDLAMEKKTLELMAAKVPSVKVPASVLRRSLQRNATFSDRAPTTLNGAKSLSRSPSFNRSKRASFGILKRFRSQHALKSAVSDFIVPEDSAFSANYETHSDEMNQSNIFDEVPNSNGIKPVTETQFSAMLRAPSSSNLLRRSRSGLFGSGHNNLNAQSLTDSHYNVLGRSMSGIFLPSAEEVGLPEELTTREEEKARAVLAEFEGFLTEAEGEELRWSPNEASAFKVDQPETVKIYEVDRLITLEKLVDSTAMNAAFRHLKKANDARKAALQLRLFQVDQMSKAQTLTDVEARNIQDAIKKAVAEDTRLTKVQQDVVLQATFEVAMKELSDALFTLTDLVDQVEKAEATLKEDESLIDDQTNALILDPENSDVSEHDIDAVRELQDDLKKQIEEALQESHALGEKRMKVEESLETESIERIGLAFHAVSASTLDPNSVEYDFDKVQEVKSKHDCELDKLKEAIVLAEKQLQALQLADQAAKEASSTICNAFAKKLFSELEAAEELWRAAHSVLVNAKNESAFLSQDLETDYDYVNVARSHVDATLDDYRNTLSQFRQGQLFLDSEKYQQLIGQIELCKKKANELGDLRHQDESKRDDLAAKRDMEFVSCQVMKLELTNALKNVHRDYQTFLENPDDLSRLVRDLKHMKEALHNNTDQAKKVTEYTELEKKHLEYEKALLANELEYLLMAKKGLDDISDASQDATAKLQYRSLMGEALLTGLDGLVRLNATPLSATERMKNKHFLHTKSPHMYGAQGRLMSLVVSNAEIVTMDVAVSLSLFDVDPFDAGNSEMKGFELDGRSADQQMLQKYKKLYPVVDEDAKIIYLPFRANVASNGLSGNRGGTVGHKQGMWGHDGAYLKNAYDVNGQLDTHFKEYVEDLMHVPVDSLMDAIVSLEARALASKEAEEEMNTILPQLMEELQVLENAMHHIHEEEEQEDRAKLQDYVIEDDDLEMIIRHIETTASVVLIKRTETETVIRRTYVEEEDGDEEGEQMQHRQQ